MSTTTLPGAGLASTPVSDVQFIADQNESVSFIGKGNSLYSIYNKTTAEHPAGTLRNGFNTPTFSSPIAGGQPQFVELGSAYTRSLIVASGGFVYRFDADSGGTPRWTYDTRRTGCATDTIQALPMVVLKDIMPSLPDDLVIVSTAYTCSPGERTTNRLIAIGANPSGAAPLVYWTSSPNLPLDRGVGGTIDYDNGAIYYSFRTPYATQPSVVRFSILTGSHILNSTPQTFVAGDVTSIPSIINGNLIVGTLDATIRVFNVATRAQLLSVPIAASNQTTLTQPLTIGRGGGFDRTVIATLQNGKVAAATLTGAPGSSSLSYATIPWVATLPNNLAASASAAFVTKTGKLYVPNVGGQVVQLNATSGLMEAVAQVGTGSLPQPALDVEGESAAANRLFAAAANGTGATASTTMKSLCIPWSYTSGGGATGRKGDQPSASGADSLSDATPCTVKEDCSISIFGGDLDGPGAVRVRACVDGACSSLPANVGGQCTIPCVGYGVSTSGICALTTDDTSASCVCDASQPISGLGCGAGSTCLSADGCHDLSSDNKHCGAAYNACDVIGYEKCVRGKCVKYACDQAPDANAIKNVVGTGLLIDPSAAAIAWRQGTTNKDPNTCEYVIGTSGVITGEPGTLTTVDTKSGVKVFKDDSHPNPISSVAVNPIAPDTRFATFVEGSGLGGLGYTKDTTLQFIDALDHTFGDAPFDIASLNTGPMAIAIQSVGTKDLLVYVGNLTKNGAVQVVPAQYQGGGFFQPGTPSDLFQMTDNYRVVGLSYAPRIRDSIDGRLWIMAGLGDDRRIFTYCDTQLNEGYTCKKPGLTAIEIGALKSMMPGFAVLSSGDYLFTGDLGNSSYSPYLISGEDLKLLDANKVNESIGLPIIAPHTYPFTVTALGGIGLAVCAPGSPPWGSTACYESYSAR